MKWTISSWQLKRWLLLAFTVCFLLQPLPGFSWTVNEWLGVVEATAGTAVLRATTIPSGDTCDDCGGTGRLGDGTVWVKCLACDGTGKRDRNPDYQAYQTEPPPAKMSTDPSPPGKEAPAVKQEAATSGGGTYKRGPFRRR